jgi:hypothetical protein
MRRCGLVWYGEGGGASAARRRLGPETDHDKDQVLDLTIEGESSESEAAVIIETENRDDKTSEDEHISVEKEQGKKEEPVLSTDTTNDEAVSRVSMKICMFHILIFFHHCYISFQDYLS